MALPATRPGNLKVSDPFVVKPGQLLFRQDSDRVYAYLSFADADSEDKSAHFLYVDPWHQRVEISDGQFPSATLSLDPSDRLILRVGNETQNAYHMGVKAGFLAATPQGMVVCAADGSDRFGRHRLAYFLLDAWRKVTIDGTQLYRMPWFSNWSLEYRDVDDGTTKVLWSPEAPSTDGP